MGDGGSLPWRRRRCSSVRPVSRVARRVLVFTVVRLRGWAVLGLWVGRWVLDRLWDPMDLDLGRWGLGRLWDLVGQWVPDR